MQLSPRRVYVGTGIAFALAAIVAWVLASRASVRVNARKQAAVAEAQLHTMLAAERPEARAIALAYLERARLGLGSPYRLVEQAVRDPRLPDSVAQNVAWTIVGRLFAGNV